MDCNKTKIKKKFEDNILNWVYSIINNNTWEVYKNKDVIKKTSDRFVINLPFIKKYMIKDLLYEKLGMNDLFYLDYIIETSLRKWQKIEPWILLDKDIIRISKYKSLIAKLKKFNIIKKVNYSYILNPYIASKTQTIDKNLMKYFVDWVDWESKIKQFYWIKN